MRDRLKVRAAIVSASLQQLKPLLPSDDLIYAFLSVHHQVESITGTGGAFMPAFDYKGILESVCAFSGQ